jgi:hypothetical protein
MPVPDRKASRVPRVVRGSVVVHRRRCGKPNCRCADGETLHETTVLSYSEAGRTRFVMLPADQMATVKAAAERYRSERARLEDQANAGLAELVAQLGTRRGRRR